jgi:transcription-repair coupling factor (superfamily II helicase)
MSDLPNQLQALAHLPEDALSWWLAGHAGWHKNALAIICRDDAHMEALRQQIGFFLPNRELLRFPAWDCQPYDRVSPNRDIAARRAQALCQLAANNDRIVLLTTANALLQRVPPRSLISGLNTHIAVGKVLDRDALAASLIQQGYRRQSKVMEPGEFALRGSIMDIFPANEGADGYPVRIDSFGDEVESILRFDPLTQTRQESLKELTLCPASEVLLSEENIARFRTQFRTHFGAGLNHPLYQAVSEGQTPHGYEHWLPLFYERMESILDYLPPGTPIIFDHLALDACDERWTAIEDHYNARVEFDKNPKLSGGLPAYHPLPPGSLYLTRTDLALTLEHAPSLAASTQSTPRWPDGIPREKTAIESDAKPNIQIAGWKAEAIKEGLHTLPEQMRHIITRLQKDKQRVLIATSTAGSLERIRQMLAPANFHMLSIDNWAEHTNLSGKSLGLAVAPLTHGFTSGNITLLTEPELLGERIIRASKKRKSAAVFMQEAQSLHDGELVVHKDHGIGRFVGLETVQAGGAPHDCLKIMYDGGDRLFVPVENSEIISRYGSADEEAKLDKLGAASWQSRKAKLKERMKMAAEELLATAAKRALARAASLSAPDGAYEEFCARFPYLETDDQMRAIEESLEDLHQEKPMDRLICGDVGFGKTEVALRAAFIAAFDHTSERLRETQSEPQESFGEPRRQVALICPTTLLARQHFKTFTERFKDLPFTIRQLSRMVSTNEAKETKELLAAGLVDIVIGTHALLADSIKFKNLGLLIIDEEQNFGVAQKEKLKSMKDNVHVLTLSATPIPRTLQLSLAGIKELSLITTPPVDRLAVRTFVMPYDPMMIREAILREHMRGGKIFYVCPRIQDLDDVAARLRALVPEIRMGIAHGQLAPGALDKLMNDFYDGKFEVLLSTNIVESGLDIPSANTLIVHKAHLFGLSQLYQLRGRVGRGKQRAYSYFTLPHGINLSRNATKRLEVMQTLDTLGAGFTIASHDMDIRGFGNILGDEQTGHIKEVGMELYQHMLEEAVEAARRHKRPDELMTDDTGDWSPQLNLGMAVMIPENYIEDINLRLGIYRRAATLQQEEDILHFIEEMTDRFGPMPEEMQNLLSIVRLKQICKQAGIDKVDAGPKGAVISFRNNLFSNPAALVEFIGKHPQSVKLRADHKLVIMREWRDDKHKLNSIQQSLKDIASLANATAHKLAS